MSKPQLGDKPKVWKSGDYWVGNFPKWVGGLYYGSDTCISYRWDCMMEAVRDYWNGCLKPPKVIHY